MKLRIQVFNSTIGKPSDFNSGAPELNMQIRFIAVAWEIDMVAYRGSALVKVGFHEARDNRFKIVSMIDASV
jgi:hypothetical protein